MRKHFYLGVGLSVVVVAVLYLAPERSALSPGVLAKGHGDLECGECHSAGASFNDDDKCVHCHERSELTPRETFGDTRCVFCHSEHNGRDFALEKVPAKRCISCHPVDTVHKRAPVELAEKLKRPPTDCLECHGNHDEHRLFAEPPLVELRKHLVAAHQEGSPLYHKDACEKCHQDIGHPTEMSAAKIRGFFEPHVTHVGRLGIRCTWCHGSVDLRQHSGSRIRRLVTTERCVQCHEGEYYPKQGKL